MLFQGSAAIAHIYDAMEKLASAAPSQKVSKEMWAGWYDQTCDFKGGNTLGPYFRVMYNILARVSGDRVLSQDEKIQYGKLLRGQLSTKESGLVGWNGLTTGSKDFSKYIEEFRLLKYLHAPSLKKVFEEFYAKKAFTGR